MSTSSACDGSCIDGLGSFEQPLPRIAPHPLYGAQFHSKDIGGLFVGKSEKVFELHEIRPCRLHLVQFIQQPVDGESQIEAYTAGWEQRLDTVESYKLAARVPARVID